MSDQKIPDKNKCITGRKNSMIKLPLYEALNREVTGHLIISRNIIPNYSKPCELILDYFCG